MIPTRLVTRVATGGSVAATGAVHALLYVDGYRAIPVIGPSFLILASGSFAVAVLMLAGAPAIWELAAAGLAAGALTGFALSRTVGLAGFVERGLDPAPWAPLSVVAEVAVLVLVATRLATTDSRWAFLRS